MPIILTLKEVNKEKRKEKIKTGINYYNSRKWQKLRDNQLRKQPLCEVCLSKGIVTAAQECHHRIPFMTGITEDQRQKLFTDETNLMSVCRKCHMEIHKEMHN